MFSQQAEDAELREAQAALHRCQEVEAECLSQAEGVVHKEAAEAVSANHHLRVAQKLETE